MPERGLQDTPNYWNSAFAMALSHVEATRVVSSLLDVNVDYRETRNALRMALLAHKARRALTRPKPRTPCAASR